MKTFFSMLNYIVKWFLTQQDWRKHGFQSFAVMLSQLTIFQMSVKYQLDTSYLLKPFKFCYFLLNLFNPASIAVVWFCSFMFIFSLLFSNEFLKPTFCPRNFWKMLLAAMFVFTYYSLCSCITITSACKNGSSLNIHSVKYMLRVFKIES